MQLVLFFVKQQKYLEERKKTVYAKQSLYLHLCRRFDTLKLKDLDVKPQSITYKDPVTKKEVHLFFRSHQVIVEEDHHFSAILADGIENIKITPIQPAMIQCELTFRNQGTSFLMFFLPHQDPVGILGRKTS